MNRECKLNPTLSQSGQNVFTLWCGMGLSDARRNSYFDADSRANRKQSSHTDRTERQSNRQALDWEIPHSFFGLAILVEYAGLGKIWKV
nr:hypothetical protein [Salmonella enterica subsp. enterica serovar Rissen]